MCEKKQDFAGNHHKSSSGDGSNSVLARRDKVRRGLALQTSGKNLKFPQNPQAASGYSLFELTVIVAILGIIVAVAIPNLTPLHSQKLELAANLVANAIRYSRAEAIRTGEAHGVTVSQVTHTVTVKSYDLTQSPADTLSVLTHPISKQPYLLDINQSSVTNGVLISNAVDAFDFKVTGRRRSLMFDADGTPIWIVTSIPGTYLLDDGDIELSLGSDQLNVRIAALTGRVTVE